MNSLVLRRRRRPGSTRQFVGSGSGQIVRSEALVREHPLTCLVTLPTAGPSAASQVCPEAGHRRRHRGAVRCGRRYWDRVRAARLVQCRARESAADQPARLTFARKRQWDQAIALQRSNAGLPAPDKALVTGLTENLDQADAQRALNSYEGRSSLVRHRTAGVLERAVETERVQVPLEGIQGVRNESRDRVSSSSVAHASNARIAAASAGTVKPIGANQVSPPGAVLGGTGSETGQDLRCGHITEVHVDDIEGLVGEWKRPRWLHAANSIRSAQTGRAHALAGPLEHRFAERRCRAPSRRRRPERVRSPVRPSPQPTSSTLWFERKTSNNPANLFAPAGGQKAVTVDQLHALDGLGHRTR